MNTKKVIFIERVNEPYKVDICEISDWEGFDKLIKFVEIHYDSIVLNKADGPDARRYFLESNGIKFELIHDDMIGNYFVAPTAESKSLVKAIGEDLEERLKDI